MQLYTIRTHIFNNLHNYIVLFLRKSARRILWCDNPRYKISVNIDTDAEDIEKGTKLFYLFFKYSFLNCYIFFIIFHNFYWHPDLTELPIWARASLALSTRPCSILTANARAMWGQNSTDIPIAWNRHGFTWILSSFHHIICNTNFNLAVYPKYFTIVSQINQNKLKSKHIFSTSMEHNTGIEVSTTHLSDRLNWRFI